MRCSNRWPLTWRSKTGLGKMKRACALGAISISAFAMACGAPAYAQGYIDPDPAKLPEPSATPLATPASPDPVLAVADTLADETAFHEVISAVVKANPTMDEGRADGAAALAAKRGADSGWFPRIDLQFSANHAFAREFSNDPDNVIERSRGDGRADANASLEQMVFDFGATDRRIEAAAERISAAEAEYDRKGEVVALRAIATWYDLFAYSHLTTLAEDFIVQNENLRDAVEKRIANGIGAPVERARVDSALANSKAQLAQFKRELSNARARFTELFEQAPPSRIARAPAPALDNLSDDALTARAADSAPVRVAEAAARAARADARAARADTRPNVTAGVDAGRYGLFEANRTDYDVRGRLTVRWRLLGPGEARADEARARADAADARAESTRLEAEREARIAWADVAALDDTLEAYRQDYLASRVTRDAVAERFRVSRGTLFEALDAQQQLFTAAARYIRQMSERDAAVFVALARAGSLLQTLGVDPADRGTFR